MQVLLVGGPWDGKQVEAREPAMPRMMFPVLGGGHDVYVHTAILQYTYERFWCGCGCDGPVSGNDSTDPLSDA